MVPSSLSLNLGIFSKQVFDLITQGVIEEYPSLEAFALDKGTSMLNLMQSARETFPAQADAFIASPWLAVNVIPKVHHCMGGLEINGQSRVLSRTNRRPITGLFAAGEATGGVFKTARMPSHSCTDALVMGRIAGQSASELVHNMRINGG